MGLECGVDAKNVQVVALCCTAELLYLPKKKDKMVSRNWLVASSFPPNHHTIYSRPVDARPLLPRSYYLTRYCTRLKPPLQYAQHVQLQYYCTVRQLSRRRKRGEKDSESRSSAPPSRNLLIKRVLRRRVRLFPVYVLWSRR